MSVADQFRRLSGMPRWAQISCGAGVLLLIVVIIFFATRSGPPPPKKEKGRVAEVKDDRAERVAEMIARAETLEEQGKFDGALAAIRRAEKINAADPRIAPIRARLEKKMKRVKTWEAALAKAEDVRETAERRDTPQAWQSVIDACEAIDELAFTEALREKTGELKSIALQRRDWAKARLLEAKEDFEGALRLIEQAIAARPPTPKLTAYKAAVEKKKRKREFNLITAAARNEVDPKKAVELWKQAEALADGPKDVEEVKRKLDELLPKVDMAVRDKRFADAMKMAETALAAGDLDAAEKAYREAQKLKGGDTSVGQGLRKVAAMRKTKAYESAMAKGRGLEEKKDWIGATRAYEGALKIKARDSAAKARIKEIESTHRPPRIHVVLKAINPVKMTFAIVKAGKFTMGDRRGKSDEKPREITFTKDVWMLTTEVTQGQWSALMEENPSANPRGSLLPVESVGWGQVMAFFEALNAREGGLPGGRTASLPSEAEWEYACRAGSKDRWIFGSTDSRLAEFAWYERNSGRRTTLVAKKKPNAWGFHDMYGNVAEWCSDWYGRTSGPATNPTGPEKGTYRCVRGGGWIDRPDTCRSAARGKALPTLASPSTGFRIVLR